MKKHPAASAAAFGLLLATGLLIACSNYSSSTPSFGAVVVSPASLTVACSGTKTFTASQTYYSGAFTAVSSDITIVTVAPTSPPDTFAVTSQSVNNGSATITVTGGGGQTATVSITNNGCVCVRHHDMWEGRRIK